MSLSLTSSIRVPKVNTGLAANLLSERRLDQEYIIAPNRALYDDYGRTAGIDTITDLTWGDDPLYRMDEENEVSRPQYSYYLNVPQGLQGVGSGEDYTAEAPMYKSFRNADTLGVNRFDSLGFAPTYKINTELRPEFSNLSYADQQNLVEMERVNRIMSRVNESSRYSNN
jgi:hypothetical protein